MGALGAERGSSRVLRPRRENDCARASRQSSLEIAGLWTEIVQTNRFEMQSKRTQQVIGPHESGVLDRDQVARPQMRHQDTFDAIQRASNHGDCRCADPIGGQLRLRQLYQRWQLALFQVTLRRRVNAGERFGERWQQFRVGVASGKVARARRDKDPGRQLQRWSVGDPRASTSRGQQQPAAP